MSRQLTRLQAVLLGILVVVAVGLGGIALVTLNEHSGWGSDNLRVLVGFDDINGVEKGTRIRIQGIDAGEIEAIVSPDAPGGKVKLQLRIAGKHRHLVCEDAKVQIASDSLFAGKVVRILPGSPSAKPIDDFGELRADVQPDVLEGIAQAAGKLNKLLIEVDEGMQALKGNKGATQDLIDSARKLNAVLTKADAALDSIEKGNGTLGKLVKNEALYNELTETLTLVKSAIHEVRNGEGTLGKLVKSGEVHAEIVQSVQEVRRMVNSVQQNSDAIKALPVVRSYVVDHNKELIRPDCKRYRMWYAEADLFEPGKAVLTARGKERLDNGALWLNEQKYALSELLIASFAAPNQNPEFAHAVTKKQSEVVMDHLRTQKVHRTGWWYWNTRPIKAIGCGTTPTPIPETEKLPTARIELIVFVPQK